MTDKKRLGRPPLDENEPTVSLSISVTESRLEFLKKHGFGNASFGVRRLVDNQPDLVAMLETMTSLVASTIEPCWCQEGFLCEVCDAREMLAKNKV